MSYFTGFLAVSILAGAVSAGKYEVDVLVKTSEAVKNESRGEGKFTNLVWKIPHQSYSNALWARTSGESREKISTNDDAIKTQGIYLWLETYQNNASCGDVLPYEKDGKTLKYLEIKLNYTDEKFTCSVSETVYK